MMNNKGFYESLAKVCFTLIGLGFSAVWAECVAPGAANSDGISLPAGATWYTDIDGKWEGCPTGQDGCFIDGGNGDCVFSATDANNEPINVTISSSTASGSAQWSATCEDQDDCAGVSLVDTVVSDSGRGANACLYGFDVDAASGSAGFEGTNIRGLYVCSDGIYEPIPAPVEELPPVNSCLIAEGSVATIHGVTVGCPSLAVGEQRTIIVSKDGKFVTVDGETVFEPEPGFGFTNADGEIDFNNICLCIGGVVNFAELQCNPAPDFFTGPAFEELEDCTVNNALPVTEVQLQNPTCVVQGGRRRCF